VIRRRIPALLAVLCAGALAAPHDAAAERLHGQTSTPVPAPPRSPVASDDTRWLPIAPSVTATIAIVAAGAAHLRRLRLRRRRAARATT
jgi:hypothetical protein